MILQGKVSDHAFLRWLERAKGIDIESLEREFVALCRPIIESGASGGWIEGDGFKIWLMIKNQNVVSAMRKPPQKFKKYASRDRLKEERKLLHQREREEYDAFD